MNNLIYFAGYVDGDGCFNIRKLVKKKHISIVITSTNIEILNHFQNIFGGTVHISKKGKTNIQKPCHQFYIGGKDCFNLCEKIIPYLIEKRKECEFLISFYTSKTICERNIIYENFINFKKNCNLIDQQQFNTLKNYEISTNPTKKDFIYFSGFIDAECSFGINKYKPKNKPNYVYKIELTCNNTKIPIFFWIKERFGGSFSFLNKKNTFKHSRNQIMWKISGKKLFSFCDKFVQYLQYKKPVCIKLIEFYKTTLKNGGARHTEEFRNSYTQTISQREIIISEIHQLNHKGI